MLIKSILNNVFSFSLNLKNFFCCSIKDASEPMPISKILLVVKKKFGSDDCSPR